jgi:ketosteroid isomerase-like protein
MSSSVSDTNDVQYQTVDGDECAYVTASYFINENKKYSRTYQTFVLRKDDDGNWKILTWYRTEGDSE